MTSGRSHVFRLAPLLAMLVVAWIVFQNPAYWSREGEVREVACQDLVAGCETLLDGRLLKIGTNLPPKVLQPFEVWVEIERVRSIKARFTMQGMDMGFNVYTLRPDRDGVFRGRVTLPVCVSGRRDWRMSLEIDGRQVEIPFVTEP